MKEKDTHISTLESWYSVKNPRPEVIRIINEYFQAKSDKNISNKEISQKFQDEMTLLKNNLWNWENNSVIDKIVKDILKKQKKEVKTWLKEIDSLKCVINRTKFQTEQSLKNK